MSAAEERQNPPVKLEAGQLPAVRLVRKHIGRRENAICVRDALAWLEGAPEGRNPRSVQEQLLDGACRWGWWMSEPDRQDFLGPLLPHLSGTPGMDELPALIRDALRRMTLGRWLPDLLRLASLRLASLRHDARSLENMDPMGPEAEELVIALAQELAREAGPGDDRGGVPDGGGGPAGRRPGNHEHPELSPGRRRPRRFIRVHPDAAQAQGGIPPA